VEPLAATIYPMAICPKCEREAPAGARACPHDGALLSGDPASATGTLIRATPPPPRDPPEKPARKVTAAKGSPANAGAAAAAEQRRTDLDAILAGESQPIVAGTLMGEYEVTVKLGEGGMGEVYAAVHPIIGKKVAIKVLSDAVAANREVVRRFVDEARAVNQIGHANIVDVFSFGQHSDGRHFYVMEHLEGCSLEDEVCNRGTLPAEEIVDIVVQTLGALQAAHDKGIIHRDLKPDNIFLTEDSRGRGIKLLDFGIAKLSGEESRSRTQTGVALGTPDYMSPEQCRGTQIDLRTDIYAVGVMLYRMFTGHFPYEGVSNVLELFMKVAHEAPTKPSAHVSMSAAFETIILKCMEKEASARFSSANELAEELLGALDAPGASVRCEPGSLAEQTSSVVEGATADMAAASFGTGQTLMAPEGETGEQAVAAISPTSAGQKPEEVPTEQAEATPPKDVEPRRSRVAPIAGASVVAIAAVAFFVTRGSSDKPKATPAKVVAVVVDAGMAMVPAPTPTDAANAPIAIDGAPIEVATGGVVIRTKNRKAEVLIDGAPIGVGKSVSIASLAVGAHTVTVRAPRFQEQTFEIAIVEDEILEKELTLKRVNSGSGKNPTTKDPEDPDKNPQLIKDKDKTIRWDLPN